MISCEDVCLVYFAFSVVDVVLGTLFISIFYAKLQFANIIYIIEYYMILIDTISFHIYYRMRL